MEKIFEDLKNNMSRIHAIASAIELEMRHNINDPSSQQRIGYFVGKLSATIDKVVMDTLGNAIEVCNQTPDK